MIKKTLYFGNPVYLSLRNAQLVIKLPEIEKNDILPENFKQQSEITDYRFQIYYFKLQCAVKRCCESNRVAVEILREKERRKL